MLDLVTSTLHTLGYPGVVGLMCLENVFPPIPSELIMPLARFLTAQGQLSFAGVVLAGMLGSVLGALPLYGVGALVGVSRLALGVHYLSDVLAAGAVGLAWLALCHAAVDTWRRARARRLS
jgi:membrane protein DedA with SNARE-associated domain